MVGLDQNICTCLTTKLKQQKTKGWQKRIDDRHGGALGNQDEVETMLEKTIH